MQLGALGGVGLSLGLKTAPAFSRPVAPSDKITVGMIAVGARAHQLIETIKQIPEAEIVAVCDAYTGRIERAISRTGGRAKAFEDYRAIIERDDIDVVVIASPDHLHARHAVEAMDAGKHIYIEKPLTYTIDEGLAIIEAERRNGVVVQVGSTGVNGSLATKARAMIAAGKLGQVTMIRASTNRNTASGAWIYPFPPDASPETVNWEQFLGSAPAHPFSLERFFRWRCYKDYSGGMSTDLFVHQCTTIHYVMNVTMCERAIAMGGLYRWKNSRDVPDTINASLAYPEGFLVSLSGTFNNQGGGGQGLQFMGTEGTLTLGRDLTFTPENVHEGNSWIVDSWPEELEAAYWQDPEVRAEEMSWTQAQHVVSGAEVYQGEGIGSGLAHFQEFFDAVQQETPTKEGAAVGHRAAACAHMVNLALDREQAVHWDAAKENIAAG